MDHSARTEEIATEIVDAAFSGHSNLGPGLLESVHGVCLSFELADRGLSYQRQLVLPIDYRTHRLDSGLRLDFLIENRVVLEIKAIESLPRVHKYQLLTYLKLSGFTLGFLVNSDVPLIKEGIHRFVMGLSEPS